MAKARGILSEYGPERTMGKSRLTGLSRPHQRDVLDYDPPTRVAVNDAKNPGLHGDNCGNAGYQGASKGESRKQSSGGPGIGGDSIRYAGSQGRR